MIDEVVGIAYPTILLLDNRLDHLEHGRPVVQIYLVVGQNTQGCGHVLDVGFLIGRTPPANDGRNGAKLVAILVRGQVGLDRSDSVFVLLKCGVDPLRFRTHLSLEQELTGPDYVAWILVSLSASHGL